MRTFFNGLKKPVHFLSFNGKPRLCRKTHLLDGPKFSTRSRRPFKIFHKRPVVGLIFICFNVCLQLRIGTLSSFVEDENENKIMTWHALRHWDENIVFGAKIES